MKTIGGDEVSLVQAERLAQVKAAACQGAQWSVAQWEEYLNAINPNFMELGLQRIGQVAKRLGIQERLKQNAIKVVTVAGTNGKGSTCALIAQCMTNQGCKVGLYTSPHLMRFNERIQIDSQNIADEPLCRCLYQVIQAQLGLDSSSSLDSGSVSISGSSSDSISSSSTEVSSSSGSEVNACAGLDVKAGSNVEYDALEPGYIDLSYFEIITLAAWLAFLEAHCEIWVLEIGLGGRLDAVNLLEHQISVITSIGLDHMKILGDTVEKIAFEKAGIIHPYDYTIIGSNIPPQALEVIKHCARERQATFKREGEAFKVQQLENTASLECTLGGQVQAQVQAQSQAQIQAQAQNQNQAQAQNQNQAQTLVQSQQKSQPWAQHDWQTEALSLDDGMIEFSSDILPHPCHLTYPRVPFICTGPALQAVWQLMHLLGRQVKLDGINQALATVALPGRMQLVHTHPAIYLDVAHNVPAALHLKDELQHHLSKFKRKIAVMGMLKDKDVEGVLKVFKDCFDAFYVASLHVPRGESQERLVAALHQYQFEQPIFAFDTVAQALAQAQHDIAARGAQNEDVLVVVGSFVTVSLAQQALDAQNLDAQA